ncbi:ankyrin [Hyaloscypha variabilis]
MEFSKENSKKSSLASSDERPVSQHRLEITSSDNPPPRSGPSRLECQNRNSSVVEHGSTHIHKRAKRMGRPRNHWTPTRVRKLVRLYLLTSLDVCEIGSVLRADDFQPSKRDLQRQLETLLQARPNLTRSVPHILRTRFRLIQECKELRSVEREKRSSVSKRNSLPIDDTVTSASCQSSVSEHSSIDTRIPQPNQSSKPYPSPETTIGNLSPQNMREDMASPGLFFAGAVTSVDTGLATPSPEGYPNSLVESGKTTAVMRSDIVYERAKSSANAGEEKSLLSTDTDHRSRRSGTSLRSLKKRLLFKHPASMVNEVINDVKSLLERLTVSDASTTSIHRPEIVSAKHVPSMWIPIKSQHAVMLPGFFHQYCWEHINLNVLQCCDDVKNPCTLGPIFQPTGKETHRTIRSDVLFRIRACTVRKDDLDELDVFGNSVFHIAASLGAPPNYLDHLVKQGADVARLNNANQTFIHLMCLSDDSHIGNFRFLLKTLARRSLGQHFRLSFNFLQQDDNGQTTIHAITASSTTENILVKIVQSFQFCGIDIPNCRDNLGHTVADQLRGDARSKMIGPDNTKAGKVVGSPAPVTAIPTQSERMKDHEIINKVGRHGSIETMEDLQGYELHADLLRTINRAGDEPAFEDSDGRNGLHCLAEVSLDLHNPPNDPQQTSNPSSSPGRDTYLDGLIAAGVDPNSHDKHGETPLMSFISTRRRDEDDPSTIRLLLRLFLAGASLNRRNRQGKTPLHIAVSLGNRAATKFLISHGANIHARTGEGIGVVAYGLRASNKAAMRELLLLRLFFRSGRLQNSD